MASEKSVVDPTPCRHIASAPATEAETGMQERLAAATEALEDLLAWAEITGGWDAPCWGRAKRTLAKLRRAPAGRA